MGIRVQPERLSPGMFVVLGARLPCNKNRDEMGISDYRRKRAAIGRHKIREGAYSGRRFETIYLKLALDIQKGLPITEAFASRLITQVVRE
jgi:hypothetical protein